MDIGNVPALLVPVVGLGALAAGIVYGRASARDTLASARRLASSAATYWARADKARSYVVAVDTPTAAMDLTELRRAHATRREKLADWAHEQATRAREAVRPERAPRDWEEGEMTAAFNAIVDRETHWADGPDWNAETPAWNPTLQPRSPHPDAPVEAAPWVSPLAARTAPVPPPPPPVVMPPRGPQTPPRWEDELPPPRRLSQARPLTPRERQWRTTGVLGPVPPLELPAFPEPFQMPQPRHAAPTPATVARQLARLAPDHERDTCRIRRAGGAA